MTTYIVHDALTGHPIGLASQSLLQAHLKLKEAVPEHAPVLIASVKPSNTLCGIIDIYEPDSSSHSVQWPRRRAVKLMELPSPPLDGCGQWASEVPIAPPAPWSWPILPPGHSYLNPENLTVEQLGDGWRPLCTLDETYPTDHQLSLTTGWAPAVPGILSKPNGRSITYRTRAPIPTLPYNP